MHRCQLILGLVAVMAPASLQSQGGPARTSPFSDHLQYLLGQTTSGFQSLRGDSLGNGTWRGRHLVSAEIDSAVAAAGTTISELDRPKADGRPGKAIVAVFPLATATAATQAEVYTRYRDLITAGLPAWQNRSTDGGDWTECADPKRGREIVLSNSRTAGGEMLVLLSITVHPDPACT
jgi:hypothetical protein